MTARSSLLLLALVSLPSLASADLVTGRVVSSTGVGVPGININAYRVSNGNEEDNLFNDGTDANGNFSTTIPPGAYDLEFLPPGPPTTTHVPLVMRNVVISGTRALGTVTLEGGIALSGHLQTQAGAPIANVSLQLFEIDSGLQIPQTQTKSNAFGNFALAAPLRAVELRLVTTGIAVPVLFSKRMTLTPTGTTNLGNITLENGFVVSGHVQRQVGGTAVTGLDLDFIDAATGTELWTPNDVTNALGNFATIVPAGTFDIEVCPSFASRLVAQSLTRVVTANLDVGIVALQPGFVLSGTVRTFAGIAQAGADIDVRDPAGRVFTCNDNTNVSGAYSVIAPAGTLRVLFHPPNYTTGLGTGIEANVVVSGDTVLDGVLPACASATVYGSGLSGTGGFTPRLRVIGGVPAITNPDLAFELKNSRGSAVATLLVGFAPAAIPFRGGTLLVSPQNAFRVALPLGGTPGVGGAGSLVVPMALSPSLIGVDFFAQFAVNDPAAAQGAALSNGVYFKVCR